MPIAKLQADFHTILAKIFDAALTDSEATPHRSALFASRDPSRWSIVIGRANRSPDVAQPSVGAWRCPPGARDFAALRVCCGLQLFDRIDTDKSGRISFDEFWSFIRSQFSKQARRSRHRSCWIVAGISWADVCHYAGEA